MIVDFKYDLGTKVSIIPCKAEGLIYSLAYSRHGIEFYVKYYDGASVKYDYFFEDELEVLEDKVNVGF